MCARKAATLAVDGGQPVRAERFPARIQIGTEEIEAVMNVMERARTQGGAFDRYGGVEVDAYEQEFAAYYGKKFGTATSSGTAAIHTALGALQLDVAQEIISSPITDPGAVFPILWMNCIPVFADADPRTMNIAPQSIAERITDRTKAIIVAHIAGQPCRMDAIMKVAEKHNLLVIEDCSQSHGARYKGKLVGTFGQMAAFSLMSGKHTTSAGQGGMLLMDDETLYWNAKRFADRGKPFNAPGITENMFMGMNYRMTELQAAIGRIQLSKTERIVSGRRRLVADLAAPMKRLKGVQLGYQVPGAASVYWFLVVRFDPAAYRVDKATFVKALAAEGVPCQPDYALPFADRPVILERKTYGKTGCPWVCPFYDRHVEYVGSCPDAHQAIRDHFIVYFHECWTQTEVEDLVTALAKVDAAYAKRAKSKKG